MTHTLRALVVVLLCAITTPIYAAGPEVDADAGGLAMKGHDPVAYFVVGKPVRGNAQWRSEFNGATYLFADQANRDAFAANPEKYAPQFGGWCAMGAALGKKFTGDPNAWKVVEGKLYLNKDAKVQEFWAKDVPGNIQKAKSNWREIESKTPAELN